MIDKSKLTENDYKSICKKYVDSTSKEMLLEKDNKILHIFIDDEFINLKVNGKINESNYTEYLDGGYNIYEYNCYKDLYDSAIYEDICQDLNDLSLFDEKGNWDYYISFEELKKIGFAFMVKDQFPLIEEYAVPDEEIFDFFDYFSLEQLKDFQNTLHLYFETDDIDYDEKEIGLYSKSDKNFIPNIIYLAEGNLSYEEFMMDYKTPSDLCLSEVINYFRENNIKDLMNYGSDKDEGLSKLSSMYGEILDNLEISYLAVYTEDGISDGKYLTTIIFENDSKIEIDTSAWNGIKTVSENIESIYEFNEKLREKTIKQNISEMEVEI